MAQVKIYGIAEHIDAKRTLVSDAVHSAVTSAFEYPPEKKFHRFIRLDEQDFLFPADRSKDYTIIEISIFEGRSELAKKELIAQLFTNLQSVAGISPHDVEITIFETPRSHWGIRGNSGDELALNYKVEV